MTRIFVSHASADQKMVDMFVETVVQAGSGVLDQELFYSSRPDVGVPAGEDLNAYVRAWAHGADLVIAVITPAFVTSRYCVAELGAAWAASSGTLFPMLAPGITHKDLDGVLSGVMVRTLDERGALDQLHDRLVGFTERAVPAARWGRQRERWLEALPELAEEVGGPIGRGTDTPGRTAKGALDWGFLFDGFVDATLCLGDDRDAEADLDYHIAREWVIPTRYHYSTDIGAKRWLRLCENADYRLRENTVAYWLSEDGEAMAERIRDLISPERRVDFISLGPGDGEKDAALIVDWLNDGLDVVYYPCDVSLRLAAHAAHRVRRRTVMANPDSLHVKVVLADFWEIETMRRVFDYRPDTPNVIALMGTLGNLSNDRQLLANLRGCMGDKDLLLLEVRVQSESDSEERMFKSDENSLKHDFGPLEHYFGLRFEGDLIETRKRTGISRIDETAETLVVTYTGPAPEGKSWPEEGVRLQYMHAYNARLFRSEVKKIGFDLVHEFESPKGFLECLLRRR